MMTDVQIPLVASRHDSHDTSCLSCCDVSWRDA